MRDEEILDLYWQRDENAIACTDAKYGNYCHEIAYNILASTPDAEECVSDTWLRVWNAIPPQRPSLFKAFLAKITRNLSLDRYRSLHAERRGSDSVAEALEELGECVADSRRVEDETEAKDLKNCVAAFVRSLPVREGNVFIRRYFFAESTAAVAKRFGLSEANVNTILSRTRKKLKNHLQEEGYML